MTTVGESLVTLLERHGVDTVFGIPGVHTVELYRGLAGSRIRHVTPRHEQGAAFMADGYARASGKPGVAFVITGPGLTNTITAMGQARADSVPMLVISGVNGRHTLGKGFGHLHELPDQLGLVAKVAVLAMRVEEPSELQAALERAFTLFAIGRPGPVHIEIPLDVMGLPAAQLRPAEELLAPALPDWHELAAAARLVMGAVRPVIMAGGGARNAEEPLRRLAELLDAPVVATTNARGLLHAHPLLVPASPGLKASRALIDASDLAIAVGTEFGPTDYDMYGEGEFRPPANLVRIDIDAEQLDRHPAAVKLEGDSAATLEGMLSILSERALAEGTSRGSERAARARSAARAEIGELGAWLPSQLAAVEAIRDALPGSIIVGDSTQPVYAANLFYDHDRPAGWFNAATGYGALGYGPPAAIGAAIARPDARVVCLTGDGGFQFTLPEVGVAGEEGVPVVFVVWNNRGYREIEVSMRAAGVEPVGVSPAPPNFADIARAYGIGHASITDVAQLSRALRDTTRDAPCIIEIDVP